LRVLQDLAGCLGIEIDAGLASELLGLFVERVLHRFRKMKTRFLCGSRSASGLRGRNGCSLLSARIRSVFLFLGKCFVEVLHRAPDKLLLVRRKTLELRIVLHAGFGRRSWWVGLRPGCEWHKQDGKKKEKGFAFHGSMLERGGTFQKSNDVRWRSMAEYWRQAG